jgi:OOP family OmpA-OmpF porin
MVQSSKLSRVFAATIGLGLLAGCAEQAAAPPPAAAMTEPQLAGAWYQVFFETNKTELNERGQMIVRTVASVAASNGATRVTVIGKTDRVGAAAANVALSQRRADQVRDALVTAGVPAARIDTSWTGEGKQNVATANDVAESRDRVVDITVVQQSP